MLADRLCAEIDIARLHQILNFHTSLPHQATEYMTELLLQRRGPVEDECHGHGVVCVCGCVD